MSTHKRIAKRLISAILTVLMLMSMVTIGITSTSAAYVDMAETGATPSTLYLTPNSNWTQANARFAAYFFDNGTTWVSMTDSDGDGTYEVAVPTGYPKVIFCRMNPSTTANNWDNKWNQTGDLTIPTDGKNLFTVQSGTWDGATTTWSKYSIPATTPATPAAPVVTFNNTFGGTGTEEDPYLVAPEVKTSMIVTGTVGDATGLSYNVNYAASPVDWAAGATSILYEDLSAPALDETLAVNVYLWAYNKSETGDVARSAEYATTTVYIKGYEKSDEPVVDNTYHIPYEIVDGLYAYAGTEVKGTNAWQRWDEVSTDNRAFYLPGSVSDTEVIVLNTYSASVLVNGVLIPANEYKAVPYEAGVTYNCSGATTQTVTFYKSDAEGTIFTNTQVGMVTKNDDKAEDGTALNTKTTIEDASYDIYSFLIGNTKNREVTGAGGAVASAANGVTDGSYVDDEGETVTPADIKKIKGRGNSTWGLDKRPFNITFNENIEIDGMKGKKWSLLANAQDPSLLRNRLVYDLANEVNMKYACDSRFVDWFVNGEYKGSYLLTQKIELGKNTVMPDLDEPEFVDVTDEEGNVTGQTPETFDFILELDTYENAQSANDNGTTTTRGQWMTFKTPDKYTEAQQAWVMSKYQAVEDALYGTEDAEPDLATLATLVDINDFARAYLINEVAKNLDSGVTSCYFVYDNDNNIFRLSPVWDYDNALGNSHSISERHDKDGRMLDLSRPDGWYAKELMHYDTNFTGGRSVFSQACYLESTTADGKTFMDIVKDVWNTDFADTAAILAGGATAEGRLQSSDAYLANLSASAEWNYKLWELSQNPTNTWIADHADLAMYTYDADANTLTYENKKYDQKTFEGQANYAADWMISRINWISAQFADAELVVPEGYITVYFTNNWNFDTVNIYYWNDTAGTSNATWPGERMAFSHINDSNETVMCAVIPADTEGVIFNGINDTDHATLRQTVDIKTGIADNAGFYCSGTTTENNNEKITVGTWTYVPETDEPVVETMDIYLDATAWGYEGATFTVQYVVADEVAVAAEGEATNSETMTAVEGDDGVFTAKIPVNSTQVAFTKVVGEDAVSTAAIDVVPESNLYTITAVDAETGEVTEGSWGTYTAPEPEKITIYFQNNWMWTDVKIYTFDAATKTDIGTAWPGDAMELYDNDGTYDIYSATITDGDAFVINGTKNDDSGATDKTPDITEGYYDGICYYMTWSDGNAVGSEDISVILPPPDETVKLAGSFTDWATNAIEMTPGEDGIVYTTTVDLAEGEYTFKIVEFGKWLGNGGTIIDATGEDAPDGWTFASADSDCTLTATGGTYTFTFNTETDKLIVTSVLDEKIRIYLDTANLWTGDGVVAVDDKVMTQVEGTVYTATILADATDITFSYTLTSVDETTGETTSTKLTAPATIEEGKDLYTLTGEAEGNYTGTWSVRETEDPDNPIMPTMATVYLINSANWAEVYAYAWADIIPVAWPGTAMEITEETVNGYDVYSLSFDATYANIIFNDGADLQTSDLTVVDGQYYDTLTGKWYEDPATIDYNIYLVLNYGTESEAKHAFVLDAEGLYSYVTLDLEAETTYEFKIDRWGTIASAKNEAEENAAVAITETTNDIIFSGKSTSATTITTTEEGTYTFAYYDSKLGVTYPEDEVVTPEIPVPDTNYYLHGEFNGWEDITLEGEGTVLSATVEIENGTYGFKIHQNGVWYGNDGTITDTCEGWTMSAEAGDCTLNATGGTYTFSLDTETMKLTVTAEIVLPTYSITWDSGNGGYMIYDLPETATQGDTVTFTAESVDPQMGLAGIILVMGERVEELVPDENGIYSFVIEDHASLFGVKYQIPDTPVEPSEYNVSYNAENATVEVVDTVEAGGTLTFTVAADEDYLIDAVLVNNNLVEANEANEYVVEDVHENIYIYVATSYDDSNDLPIQPPVVAAEIYTVTFVDYNNTLLSVQKVESGNDATAPDDPTRSGYTFTGWDTDYTNVTEDIIVVAQYSKNDVTPAPAPTTGTLKVDISGGTSFTLNGRPQGTSYHNTQMAIGTEVTLVASSSNDNEFFGWVYASNGAIASKTTELTFTTTGDDNYKALYKSDIDGVQAVIFKNDKLSGGMGQILDMQYYSASETIEFAADTAMPGWLFQGWILEGDATKTLVTNEMIQAEISKGNDVTIVPKWTREIVYVNVTVNGGTGGGQVVANVATTVTANAAPDGEKFAYWVDGKGIVKSYSQSYTFYPKSDMKLSAVFVSKDEEVVEQILVSMDSAIINTTYKGLDFTMSWYVPDDYNYVTGGIVAVDKANYVEANFYAGANQSATSVYTRNPNTSSNLPNTPSFTWTKSNIADGATWVTKAYIQYKDANGEIVTIYSDVVEFTKTEDGVEVN